MWHTHRHIQNPPPLAYQLYLRVMTHTAVHWSVTQLCVIHDDEFHVLFKLHDRVLHTAACDVMTPCQVRNDAMGRAEVNNARNRTAVSHLTYS